MAQRTDIVALVEAYVDAVGRQDVEAAVEVFAEDAVVDDPVGEGHNVGHDQIREFLRQWFSVGFTARLDGPVGVHGSFAAFRYVIEIPAGRTPFRVQVTDLAEVRRAGDGLLFTTLKVIPDSTALN